jgi:uncharacterized protein (DUF488 family)
MITTIYTIGHSTHTLDEFLNILHEFEIGLVVDVRTIPKSRFNPQFNEADLDQSLKQHNIGYTHLKELGGLRHTTKTSINTAWKNLSFRGFADYMQTEEFQKGIDQLISLAQKNRTVIMCAEAVPWRCHRSLIGDALLVRNINVEDIMSEKTIKPHKITPWANVDGVVITYPETAQAAENR